MVLVGYLCHSDRVAKEIILKDISEINNYKGYLVGDREVALSDDPWAIPVYVLYTWYEVYATFRGGVAFAHPTASYKEAVERALQLRNSLNVPRGQVWVVPHYCPRGHSGRYQCDGSSWHEQFPPVLTW